MRPFDALIAIFVMIVWGFNFVAARWGLAQFPPILMMGLRFGLIAILLLPFAKPPRGKMKPILLLSVTLGCAHFSMMFTGLRDLDAATVSIAIQTQVPFAALLAAIFLGDTLGWRRALGMAVAFSGVVLIAGEPRVGLDGLFPLSLVVGAAFIWSVANIQIKGLGAVDGFALNAFLSLFAAPQLFLVSFFLERGQIPAILEADVWAWGSVVYMAVMVTIVSYVMWYRLLRRYPVNVAMPFTLLVPVVGVLSAVLFLGEPLSWRTIVGGIATLIGVGIIIVRRPQLPDPEVASKTT